jgi:hypothetical protein
MYFIKNLYIFQPLNFADLWYFTSLELYVGDGLDKIRMYVYVLESYWVALSEYTCFHIKPFSLWVCGMYIFKTFQGDFDKHSFILSSTLQYPV